MTPKRDHLRVVEPPSVAGRPPPHDLETEAAVLNTVFVYGSAALDDIRELVSDADWFSEANRTIWRALCAVRAAGGEPSPLTAGQWLMDHDLLRSVGGAAYLSDVSSYPVSMPQLVTFADRIRRKARLRRAIAAAQLIAAEGYGELDDETAEQWLEGLPERLRGDETERAEAFHVGESLAESWKTRAEEIAAARVQRGPSTGLPDLDAKIGGLRPGKVMAVAARSFVGKTAFAFQVASHVAQSGHGVLIHQLEAPKDETLDRLHYATAAVDGSKMFRGVPLAREEMGALTGAIVDLQRAPLYADTRSSVTVTDIRASARRMARRLERRGVKLALVVVDYVQLVSARDMSDRGANREAQVAHVSREIKRMAMDLDVHVMLLGQLNKDADKRTDDSRPRTSDIRESSAVENDADHILLLHNPHRLARSRGERDDEPSDDVELILGKNRGGKPGTIHALWMPSQQSFRCVERREEDRWS